MVGFYRCGCLGDNVISLYALYVLRKIYKGKIVIYTTNYEIFSKLEGFTVVDVRNFNEDLFLKHINSCHFESFFLTQPKRKLCSLLAKTNARTIFTFATFSNFLNFRFKKVFFFKAFSKKPYYKALIELVSKINPSKDELNLDKFSFPLDLKTIAYIETVLENLQNTKISNSMIYLDNQNDQMSKFKFKQNLHAKAFASKPIICINAFAISTQFNLPLASYISLAKDLCKHYKNAFVFLLSYKNDPSQKSKITQAELNFKASNLYIVENNSNLLNLIELLRSSVLLVSPSTGAIHLACMLGIATVGIYSKKDARLWLGPFMSKKNLLILNKPLNKLKQKQITKLEQDLKHLTFATLSCLL